MSDERLLELLAEAKRLAKEYRALTGRPLGVTGEVAEYEVARLLDVELSPVRQAGYDAIRETPVGPERLQIKEALDELLRSTRQGSVATTA